ncbi:hypothetical protein OSB04_000881 [Centaurea solstitialis]|uniref:Cytochrome P450 n=1 Tax=Centaurea solstitialis TaxID=347529 RepID=A0AA38TPZ9_9ASTR|nr:hypothetical protein OSB04_000881 [Centaurea solstitialis]
MEGFPQFLPILGFFIFLLISSYKRSKRNNTIKSVKLAPEPSGALPLIGHLHFLRAQSPVAKILGKIADDYGPAYTLRLGSRQALVVSSWQMAKDCFNTNDKNFATRPNMAISQHILYNEAGFAMAPYGPYWREIRKLVTSELFTSQRLEKHKNIRNSEINSFVNNLFFLSTVKNGNQTSTVDMSKWFEHVTFNITLRNLVGKRFFNWCRSEGVDEDSHVSEAIKKALYLSGVFVASDFFPNLEWMDIGGHLKAMKEVTEEIDIFIEKWLKEHIEKKKENDGGKDGEDFMDVMLSTLSKDDEMFGHRRETIIKATIMTLMLTGTESTALTLTWALSLLLNNPHVLRVAQEELDIHVGREKWVEESDIKNLRYLQAIVKETLRMYPPGPLAGPHEAIEDCNIGGYHVSKGTRLIVNVWKLQHDPQVWSDPHDFRPERFLEQHLDKNYHGQNYEYIPFSSGRRMCPAITFAFQVVHLTLSRLLQGFHLSTPMGKPVDMSEGLGIALPKVKPLEVIITPRLPPKLYDQYL